MVTPSQQSQVPPDTSSSSSNGTCGVNHPSSHSNQEDSSASTDYSSKRQLATTLANNYLVQLRIQCVTVPDSDGAVQPLQTDPVLHDETDVTDSQGQLLAELDCTQQDSTQTSEVLPQLNAGDPQADHVSAVPIDNHVENTLPGNVLAQLDSFMGQV